MVDIIKGAIGLTKVALGIKAAPDEIIEKRLLICTRCEHMKKSKSKRFKKLLERCGICGCFLYAKITLKDEQCPLDIPKWRKYYEKSESKNTNRKRRNG